MDVHVQGTHQNEPIDHKAINSQCGCFAMRKAARAVTQFFDHTLEPTGLRSTQFNLLVTMASVSSQTLTEMAQILVMDRTTLTRNLKPLEKMGLIKSSTPKDKRSKAYSLTDKGRETVAKAVPLWRKAQGKIVGSLSDDRFNHLLKELTHLTTLINEF